MAGKRAAPRAATKAQPTSPDARIVEAPSAGPIGPTGYPPVHYPTPSAPMPTNIEVTNISAPDSSGRPTFDAWPTTPPILGGISPSAQPVAPLFGNAEMHPVTLPNDDPPYPPDTTNNATPMSNLPFQTAPQVPYAQLGPAGQVTLPSGSVPQATTSETAGEVPFRPAETTEQGR